jgi:hypothetical protein
VGRWVRTESAIRGRRGWRDQGRGFARDGGESNTWKSDLDNMQKFMSMKVFILLLGVSPYVCLPMKCFILLLGVSPYVCLLCLSSVVSRQRKCCKNSRMVWAYRYPHARMSQTFQLPPNAQCWQRRLKNPAVPRRRSSMRRPANTVRVHWMFHLCLIHRICRML